MLLIAYSHTVVEQFSGHELKIKFLYDLTVVTVTGGLVAERGFYHLHRPQIRLTHSSFTIKNPIAMTVRLTHHE